MEQNLRQDKQEYIITKRIAKQGDNAILIIPRFLRSNLKPKTIVEVKIKVIKNIKEIKNGTRT